jgi:hypothetical protein
MRRGCPSGPTNYIWPASRAHLVVLCFAWHEAALLGFRSRPREMLGLADRALLRRLSNSRHVGSTSPTNAVATGKRLHPSREAARFRCPIAVIQFLDGCCVRARKLAQVTATA